MCNTHGWIAADEMWSITQSITHTQEDFKFTTPVYWSQQDTQFTASPFGEVVLFNNVTNVITVLIDDHWAAIELLRQGDQAHAHFVQFPHRMHTAATFVVARMLQIPPHRIQVTSEAQ